MDGGIYSTGNTIVDENAKLNISGNVIPQSWYRTIVRDSGKPHLTAIIILADIVYWYKPTEIRDEGTGQVIAVKKKFKADLLQRSYQQISEQFGISKKEATNAIIFLEKLGVVRRVFRTVNINGLVVNNVLFLELIVNRLWQLTYPEDSCKVPPSFDSGWEVKQNNELTQNVDKKREHDTYGEGAPSLKRERVSLQKERAVSAESTDLSYLKSDGHTFYGGTNTKITQENNTIEYTSPIQSYQATEEMFKEQIDYDAIWIDRPFDRKILEEIVSIAVDVLTSTAKTIRINREDKPAQIVKGIYRKIEKPTVEFVMDSLRNCGSKANNIRAVIITALYNAVMTTSTQLALAEKLGISLRTYQRIEYGEQKPNVHVVIRLQRLFQKNIDELIKESAQ